MKSKKLLYDLPGHADEVGTLIDIREKGGTMNAYVHVCVLFKIMICCYCYFVNVFLII